MPVCLFICQDQRQVCTGEGLRSGVIADDCESSASFLKSENKTLMAIRALLMQKVPDFLMAKKDLEVPEELVNVLTNHPIMFQGWSYSQRRSLVLAVANILRQFEFEVDLCIGTANAAAVGAAAQLSGHCYARSRALHLPTQLPMMQVLEGTR